MIKLNFLIPFNLIIDTDAGLINLIKDEYNQKSVFDFKKVGKLEEFLIHRKNINPLYGLITPEIKTEDADQMYKDFMDQRYDDIILKSSVTLLLRTIIMASKGSIITITILYSDDREKQCMERIFANSKLIIKYLKKEDKINLENYDGVYLKDFRDIMDYYGVIQKSIYVANYDFNVIFDENGNMTLDPNLLLSALPDGNEVKIFNIY